MDGYVSMYMLCMMCILNYVLIKMLLIKENKKIQKSFVNLIDVFHH